MLQRIALAPPRKLRRWIWLTLAVTALLAAGYVGWRLTRKAPASVELRKRELKQTIVSSGQVMPPAEVRLDSMLTSTITQIFKREGDSVRAGEVLIALDESDLAAMLTQAQAAVAQARVGKSSLRTTTLPQANEALSQVRTNLLDARRELARQRSLFDAGITTASVLEKAQTAVTLFESQEKAALSQVLAASTGGSANLSASASIDFAQAQVAAIEVNRERAKIVAPMDGVISSRLVEVGEVVRPGTPLLVLTALGRTRIALEPDERNLALLALGQKASVSAEAFPDESFEASLGYIAPAVNGERGTIEVRLDVPNPPAYLRPNMTVSVELSVATRSDALALPLTAVQDVGGLHPWIGVMDAHGAVQHREVRLGLKGDELVEILSGADAGERVMFEPPLPKISNGAGR